MDDIRKLFARIPKKHRTQLLEILGRLLDPAQRAALRPEKLSNSSQVRVRAGRYRIIFHVDTKGTVIIDEVRLRNENTYRDV